MTHIHNLDLFFCTYLVIMTRHIRLSTKVLKLLFTDVVYSFYARIDNNNYACDYASSKYNFI